MKPTQHHSIVSNEHYNCMVLHENVGSGFILASLCSIVCGTQKNEEKKTDIKPSGVEKRLFFKLSVARTMCVWKVIAFMMC